MTIPAGYAQCNVKFIGTALPHGAEIVFGLDNSVGKTMAQLGTIVANALASSNIMTTAHTTCFISGFRLKFGPDATGQHADFSLSIGGAAGSSPAPANTGFLLRKATALGGRHGAGRLFMPGVPTEAIANGQSVTSAYQTALYNEFNALVTALSTATTPMVLLHADATTPTEVTSMSVSPLVATQRRRLRG